MAHIGVVVMFVVLQVIMLLSVASLIFGHLAVDLLTVAANYSYSKVKLK